MQLLRFARCCTSVLDLHSKNLQITLKPLTQGYIYTQTKVKQHNIFFGDTVLEVAERNIRVMEIKYFEFYCKFYYFDEHFALKWSCEPMHNSRPCTKQVKNDTEKQWKKFVADVWKIIFSMTFNSMESYHPKHLQVYYKFLKNMNLLRT